MQRFRPLKPVQALTTSTAQTLVQSSFIKLRPFSYRDGFAAVPTGLDVELKRDETKLLYPVACSESPAA
jgi:hypothetical protein